MKRIATIAKGCSPSSTPPANVVSESDALKLTLENFAYRIINEQYQYILTQEAGVIADQDSEYLHQMRVGFRRFQAAMTVFRPVVVSSIDPKRTKRVLKSLGGLRDLDVQLQGITIKCKQAKTPGLQKSLMRLQRDLKQKRRNVYQQVCKVLTKKPSYQIFKQQTQKWLKHPQYAAISQLPIQYCAPELLSPILTQLLLHPAWLLPQTAMMSESSFHDLRKLCKQVRYQGEFFLPLYPKAFKIWIKEIKSIQSGLGELQDAHVFGTFLQQYQPGRLNEKTQGDMVWQNFTITQDWETLRQRYTDPTYRRQLHELILSPHPH